MLARVVENKVIQMLVSNVMMTGIALLVCKQLDLDRPQSPSHDLSKSFKVTLPTSKYKSFLVSSITNGYDKWIPYNAL